MLDIDWEELPHAQLIELSMAASRERVRRIKELDALAAPVDDSPRGRGRPPKSAFPESARGALDAVGEAQ